MPALSQARTARAVGAETATIIGAPMQAVFWTISIETRLLNTRKPSCAAVPVRAKAPASLSSALCRPTSSRTIDSHGTRSRERAALETVAQHQGPIGAGARRSGPGGLRPLVRQMVS
jgi:hypothetical protein